MVLNLKTCCCCVDLRTGSLIIAYFSLASYIGTLLYILVESRHLVTSDNISEDTKPDPRLEKDDEEESKFTLPIFSVGMIGVIVSTIFIILLIVGIHKEKPKYVLAYIIYGIVSIVSMVFFFVTGISTNKPIPATVACTITILLSIYFLLVIRSYYKKMRAQERSSYA